ncbi:MAG: hypothetical protein ACLQAH_06390 [Limisphaerales bacterium]
MKTKLPLQIPAVLLILVAVIITACAQPAPKKAPAVNPVTGLPASGGVPLIDPNTGLPPAPAPWKDPNWPEPAKVLPNVNFRDGFDGLPVTEVVRYLREQFSNDFDVVFPQQYNPTPTAGGPTANEAIDPSSILVKLQLKNVTASEVFNAMNLEFETENTPARWELIMNGRRPTAVFRFVPALLPSYPVPPPAPEPKPTVYFVGDLMGTEKSAGMTMDQIVKTVSEVWRMTYGEPGETIQFHQDAQLLIIKGTPDQIKFVEATLQAMRKKVELEQSRQKAAESRPKNDEPKSAGGIK